jgi:hypothetical protein
MQSNPSIMVVLAWQDAANRQDVERLLELSDPNIENVGPRGSGYGHPLLRDWLARAGLHLTTRRVFAQDDRVVVAQHAVWRTVETGAVQGESDVASRFRVVDGCIAQFARYDDLTTALADAGLALTDEVL